MSTSISGPFRRLGVAGSLVGLLALGCLPHFGAINPTPTAADAQRQGLMGTVRLSFGALKDPSTWASNRIRIQAADTVRVNRVRITLMSADGTYKSDQIVTLSLSNNEATFSVPFGRNFIALAQGLNGDTDVPGVFVGGHFDIKDTGAVNVTLNGQTTPVAEIVRYLMAKAPTLAQSIDLATLQSMVTTASANGSPLMINPGTFAEAIIANQGLPTKAPSTTRFVAGRIIGEVEGLEVGEVAIISVSDPASKPFVMVGTGDTQKYRIDNVVPGTWTVRIVSSIVSAEAPEQIVTLGTPYVAPTPVSSGSAVTARPTPTPTATPTTSTTGTTLPPGFAGPEATVSFTLTLTEWRDKTINVSSNVGISDQPDVAIDGIDDIHAVWRQDFNPDLADSNVDAALDKNPSGAIFYSRWNGRNWSREHQNISGIDQQGAREPAITVGVDRLPHVIWSGLNGSIREIRYAKFDGSAWTKPTSISVGADDQHSAVSPDMAIDKVNGHLYAVWQGGDGPYPYFAEYHGSGWTKATRLSSQTGRAPRVATGYDGSIHVAWVGKDNNKVYYLRFVNGAWDSAIELPLDNGLADPLGANTLDLSVDRTNRIHLIWRSGANVGTAFSSAGTWTQTEKLNPVGNNVASQASLNIDPVGNLHTLWRIDTGATVFYRRRTNQGWQAVEDFGALAADNVTANAFVGKDRAMLVSDSRGNLHAFWSQKFANAFTTPAGAARDEFDILHLIRRNPEEDDE